jgi:hypothetical protein
MYPRTAPSTDSTLVKAMKRVVNPNNVPFENMCVGQGLEGAGTSKRKDFPDVGVPGTMAVVLQGTRFAGAGTRPRYMLPGAPATRGRSQTPPTLLSVFNPRKVLLSCPAHEKIYLGTAISQIE